MIAKNRTVSIGLVVLSLVIWLSACLVNTGFSLSYARPVTSTTIYWWCYAPILAFFGFTKESGDVPAKKHGRLNAVILSLLALLLACVLWHTGTSPFYELYIWQFTALLLAFLMVWLFNRCHPHFNFRSAPQLQRICAVISAVYIPVLLSTLMYISVLHPVPVEKIRPVGELEGGRYIGRITGDRRQNPLGVYFFADGDRWYYYDVLTGEPVQYDDPIKEP